LPTSILLQVLHLYVASLLLDRTLTFTTLPTLGFFLSQQKRLTANNKLPMTRTDPHPISAMAAMTTCALRDLEFGLLHLVHCIVGGKISWVIDQVTAYPT
jgi:hypothetical protein